MLTIFTIPKPFKDHISVIQKNAIKSWTLLEPSCEIILFGDEEGVEEIAQELGVRHIQNIAKNEYGTPLLSDVFTKAHREARNGILCYVNADIILLQDFIGAIRTIQTLPEAYLMVGQRWDVDIDVPWDFSVDNWQKNMHDYLKVHAKIHPPAGSDYFVFPGDTFESIPPFAVGRAGWDNWMIYNARTNRIPVIDATAVTTVIHQNHDYSHVKHNLGDTYENPESARNREIIGDRKRTYTLKEANLLLTPEGLAKNVHSNEYNPVRRLQMFLKNIIVGRRGET
ncbi:hypothetical protein [Methanoculleus chikugoensis]|uniref:Glycosyltransferase n=1 Tax=Methanoculleus chikugoensis TaxID=118126 RepID=A0ABN5XL11_9EURY|nr:hypothetical protein [Methanoculleus chikugoensis]BBL68638.1 hypothetical protein MchiMG62_18190 [Methanoculleus chikugoensis]